MATFFRREIENNQMNPVMYVSFSGNAYDAAYEMAEMAMKKLEIKPMTTVSGVESLLAEIGIVGEFVTKYHAIDSAIRFKNEEYARDALAAAGIEMSDYLTQDEIKEELSDLF